MRTEVEKIEEELRSEIYTALVELCHVGKENRAGVARRLLAGARKLHDLIVHGRLPENMT
jgi:hypothetical protein